MSRSSWLIWRSVSADRRSSNSASRLVIRSIGDAVELVDAVPLESVWGGM